MKKIREYTLFKLLGKGSFGEVYLTQKENSPVILATKILDKKQTDRPSVKKYFDNEISIMKELNHPNIVRFYDMIPSYSHYYVVMEYCNGGSLSSCLKKYKKLYNKPFSQEIVQFLMKQIVDGIRYIHSHKIIHRDIKLDNILASFQKESDKNNLNMMASQVKIIDFGLATRLGPQDLTYTALGSPINMDPLILKKFNKAGGYEQLQGYNEKADIWSLGTICYELLTGEAMFKVKDIKDLMKKVENGNYTIPININLSKEAVSFLNAMLQYDFKNRLSADELAKHDFIVKNVKDFSKVDLDKISNKIDNKGLNINVKQNETIWNMFNNENQYKEINPNINQNRQNNHYNQHQHQHHNNNHKSPFLIRKKEQAQNFVVSNNIYEYDNKNYKKYETQENFNDYRIVTEGYDPSNNIVKIPTNINKHFENYHKITEGYVSPNKNIEKRKEFEKKRESDKKLGIEKNNISNIINKKNSEKSEKEKEKEELKQYINGLLQEYRSAREYFKANNLKNQEEDANQKYQQIKISKKQFEQGNSINPNSFPKPITPEYIYGCSTAERDSKFKEIITKYTNDKNALEAKIAETISKLKKLNSEQYAKIKGEIKPKLEGDKAKLGKLKLIIEGFENKFKNKWVPAPKLKKTLEEGLNEKDENESNTDYKLKIHLGKTDYKKETLLLNIFLRINEEKTLSKDVKLKKIGDFDEDIVWILNPNEWNNINNYLLILEYCYGIRAERNWVKLNISQIKDTKELTFDCPIDLFSENIIVKVNIHIKAIFPKGKKDLEQGKKAPFFVKKIYPAFEGKSNETNNIPKLLLNK